MQWHQHPFASTENTLSVYTQEFAFIDFIASSIQSPLLFSAKKLLVCGKHEEFFASTWKINTENLLGRDSWQCFHPGEDAQEQS